MKKNIAVLLSAITIFAVLSSVAGCSSGGSLANGCKFTLTPAEETSAEELEAAAKIVKERLLKAFSNAEVENRDGKLFVKTPKIDNPDAVMEIICEKGGVDFKDSAGNVRLRGEHVKTAKAGYNESGEPSVFLEFTEEGTGLFAQATKDIADGNDGVENVIYIYLGSIMISAPKVTAEIPNGLAMISDFGSFEKAKAFAAATEVGRLGVGFNVVRENA